MKVLLKKDLKSKKFNVIFKKGVPLNYDENLKSVEHPTNKNIWLRVEPKQFTQEDESNLLISEALDLLETHFEKNKERVHTLEGFGFGVMGCDIDLSEIKEKMKRAERVCLAGVNMTGMGHGVAILEADKAPLFLKTIEKKLNALHKKRKISLVVSK